jgi:hypothetical protein
VVKCLALHEHEVATGQPSPTSAQCLNGGTEASVPLDAFRRPRKTRETCRRAHNQAHPRAADHTLRLGASGRGAVMPPCTRNSVDSA